MNAQFHASPVSDHGIALAAKASALANETAIKKLHSGRTDLYRINPYLIMVEDGFNVRNFESVEVKEHVEGLAQSIAETGVQNPIKVRNKGGKLYLIDGECRLRATIHAIEVLGASIESVPVILADRSENEADAVLDIMRRNSGLPLGMPEQAVVVKRLRAFGWSATDIAKKAGISVGRVHHLVAYSGMSPEIHSMVAEGIVAPSVALGVARDTNYDDDKTVDLIRTAAKKVAAEGKTRVTTKALGGSFKSKVSALVAGATTETEDDIVTMAFSQEQYDELMKLLGL